MKFLLLFLFLPLSSIGQQSDSVTKIVFHFNNGHNDWGETQQYAESETIEFIPNSKGTFICNHFEQVKFFHYKDTSGNGLYKKDTTIISHPEKFKISREHFNQLLIELNSNNNNFTSTHVLPFLKPYSKEKILELAKSNRREYLFIDNETNKVDESGKENIKKIREFFRLDSFMNKMRPDIKTETIITDVWGSLSIIIFNKDEIISFDMRPLPMEGFLLGQPVDKRINGALSPVSRVINININKILIGLLPRKSLARPAMDFNSIREMYLDWLLENNNFLSEDTLD